ncbi:MAG: hypothetical protein FJ020_01805 [Chloroflexi bacterium]|nr:hypothetical protein [Chloroflexota bacterium]
MSMVESKNRSSRRRAHPQQSRTLNSRTIFANFEGLRRARRQCCSCQNRRRMRFESSAEISASPEAIWAALGNPEEWPEWIASLKRIERLSAGTLGVGARLRVTARAGLFTVKLLMTITEFVPGQRVVMQGRVLGTGLTRYYALNGGERQTRVTAGGEATGALACLVGRGGQRLSNEIVRSFKKKIEG